MSTSDTENNGDYATWYWDGLTSEDFVGGGFSQIGLMIPIRQMELYPGGCMINGTRNCTATCSQSANLWAVQGDDTQSTLANLANCMAYSFVSNLLDTVDAESKNRVAELAANYSILPASQIDLAQITTETQRCLNATCSAPGAKCISPFQSVTQLRYYKDKSDSYTNYSMQVSVPDYDTICSNVKVKMNPDVAGIGILSAYIIAAGLLLLLYAGLRLSQNWLVHVSLVHYRIAESSAESAKQKARDLQKRVKHAHHTMVLVWTLAEFQKGQSLFWLATSIAGFIAIGSAGTLSAESIVELSMNLQAVTTICLAALVFTTFGQYCLWAAHKKSAYILTISTTTALVSSVAFWIISMDLYYNEHYKVWNQVEADKNDNPYDGCSNIALKTWCDQYGSFQMPSAPGDYRLARFEWLTSWDLKVVIFSFVNFLNVIMVLSHILAAKKIAELAIVVRVKRLFENRFWHIIRLLLQALTEAALVTFTVLLCIAVSNIYYEGGGAAGGMNTWGFGQIIALSIWVPVVLEWLYASIKGIEQVVGYRMVPPYQLKLIHGDHVDTASEGIPLDKVPLNQATRAKDDGGRYKRLSGEDSENRATSVSYRGAGRQSSDLTHPEQRFYDDPSRSA